MSGAQNVDKEMSCMTALFGCKLCEYILIEGHTYRSVSTTSHRLTSGIKAEVYTWVNSWNGRLHLVVKAVCHIYFSIWCMLSEHGSRVRMSIFYSDQGWSLQALDKICYQYNDRPVVTTDRARFNHIYKAFSEKQSARTFSTTKTH